MSVLAAQGVEAASSGATEAVPAGGGARFGVPTRIAIAVLAALAAWAALGPALRPAADWGRWASEAAARWRTDAAHLVPQAAAAVVVTTAAALLARSRRPRAASVTAAWIALVAVPSLWFGWRF